MADNPSMPVPGTWLPGSPPAAETAPPDPRLAWLRRSAIVVIAALAGLSYAWQLGMDPLEPYYAAAVRSMSGSWHDFIFGAFDPAGTITLDKLPGAFWVQALSVRAFGDSTWAMVLPQVVEGVVTVLVLYRAVTRLAGPAAGLVAALVLAASPAVVALDRGNISDSLMILLLVLAADGVIAQMLLDQVAFLDQRITAMENQAIAALAQVEESWGVDATGETGPGCGTGPDSLVLAAAHRLAEIPGVSLWLAIVIIAEIGLTMTAFPTPAHLVSWIGLCRSAAQSGTRHGKGKQKKGNSYARAAAGQAALGAAGTATFLGERYRRIARRRGGAIAQVAVARSIMIIAWHLLSDPQARYRDLGPDWHARRTNRDKKIRTHIQGLKALGVTVAITDDEHAA